MTIKTLLVDGVIGFAVSLIVSAIVTMLWNLIVHETSTIDWETSFRIAILLGIIVSLIGTQRSKKKRNAV